MKFVRILAALLALSIAATAHAQVGEWLWWGATQGTIVPVSNADPLPVTVVSGGGSLTVTDGTNSVANTTTLAVGNGYLVGGSAGSATLNSIVPNRTVTTSTSIAAGDMTGQVNYNGSSITATVPAISSSIFASGMSAIISNRHSTALTVTSTPTIGGCANAGTIFQYGFMALVSNGTSLDCVGFPGFGALSGAITSTGAGVTSYVNTSLDLTTKVTGTLPYGNGGTGATSLTNHGVVVAGASAQSTVAPSTSGNVLTSNGTDWTSAAAAAGGGGGLFQYSDNGLTLTANTRYVPIGGSGVPSTTENDYATKASSALTVNNLQVTISADPGSGQSLIVTLRKNKADTTLTCTITGPLTPPNAVCQDLTHSVSVAQNDNLDWSIQTTGTFVATPSVTILANSGTTNNGVTGSGTANAAAYFTSSAAVASGVAMTNGQLLIGSTGSTPVNAALTAGTGITVTNGAGSSTVASATLLAGPSTPQLSKTSDTTLANIGGISMTLTAKTYFCHGAFPMSAGATGGEKIALHSDGTLAFNTNTSLSIQASNTGTSTAVAGPPSTADIIAGQAGNGGTLLVDATLVVSTGGVLTLQGAQQVSNGTATIFLVGGYFKCTPTT